MKTLLPRPGEVEPVAAPATAWPGEEEPPAAAVAPWPGEEEPLAWPGEEGSPAEAWPAQGTATGEEEEETSV